MALRFLPSQKFTIACHRAKKQGSSPSASYLRGK
jgi:hypothetical protein